MKQRISTVLIIAAALMVPLSAAAQIVSFGGEEPIYVKAERATYKGPKTTLVGKVDVRQGSSQIYSRRMDIFRRVIRGAEGDGTANYGDIFKIDAIGRFQYITPENEVTGDKGVYERDKRIITITGNVVYTQSNGNRVTGDKLIYDLTTNNARFIGDCIGEGCRPRERVEITYGSGGN